MTNHIVVSLIIMRFLFGYLAYTSNDQHDKADKANEADDLRMSLMTSIAPCMAI